MRYAPPPDCRSRPGPIAPRPDGGAGRSQCLRQAEHAPTTPTRLVHLANNVDAAEDHHLHADQRLRDEFVRLVNDLLTMAIPPGYGAMPRSAMDQCADDHDCDDVAHLDQRIDRRAGPVNVVDRQAILQSRSLPRASTRSTCKRQPESLVPLDVPGSASTPIRFQERNNPGNRLLGTITFDIPKRRPKPFTLTPQVGACAGDLRPARPARALRHRASEPAPYTCCWHYGRTRGEIRDQRRRGRPR